MAEETEFGIDELARRAGATVRTVRMYQERGLLPPPVRRGRSGVYAQDHLTRLQLVKRLADRGYSLAAIKDLADAWDAQRGLGHILDLEDVLAEPVQTETPLRLTAEELTARFPGDDDLVGRTEAIEIGLLVPDGEDFIAPSPLMLDAGVELMAGGVPLMATLAVARRIKHAANELADTFVTMFLDYTWTPFEQDGEPDEQLPAILDAISRQRQLALQTVSAALAQALDERVDRAVMMDAQTT